MNKEKFLIWANVKCKDNKYNYTFKDIYYIGSINANNETINAILKFNEKNIEKELNNMLSGDEILEYEIIISKDSDKETVPGEYYAHEYDEYILGKCTRYKLPDGYQYFIDLKNQKLRDKYIVTIGWWDPNDCEMGSKMSNGCGDTFTPFKNFKKN